MFAPETYRPTHTGPFLATGEMMRRARNDAQAAGDAQSVARGYMPMRSGVRAGGRGDMLRASLLADTQRMQGTTEAMQAYNQLAQSNAMANLQSQVDAGKEMAGLRDLLFSKQATDYSTEAAEKDRAARTQMFAQEMRADRQMARMQENAAKRRLFGNIALGLLGGIGFGSQLNQNYTRTGRMFV